MVIARLRRIDLPLVAINWFCTIEDRIRGRACPICKSRYHQLEAHIEVDHYPGEK